MYLNPITGVYKITNKITGEFYIGSSVNVRARLSNHMGRDARKYYGKHKFHTDVIDYGRSNFDFEVLEECEREKLIEREQFYYDLLKPNYNFIRPTENNFRNKKVIEKAMAAQQTPEFKEKRNRINSSKEYKQKCKMVHTKGKRQMKPVTMITESYEVTFESISAAARWVSHHTNFKAKNKASMIKRVCDGERPLAFGYQWRYENV